MNHHEPLISEVYTESEVLCSYRLSYFKTTAFKFIMVRECNYNLGWSKIVTSMDQELAICGLDRMQCTTQELIS